MGRNRLYLTSLVLALSATAAAAGLATRGHHAPAETSRPNVARHGQGAGPARKPYPFRVLPSRLLPQLRAAFEILGDRLHRPGKERLTLSGTLTREGVSRPVQILYEPPHLLRISDAGLSLLTFDEREAMRGGRAADAHAGALAETFFYDSAEHFFFAQARGAATRLLGSRVRPEEAAEGYDGPSYDVYEVREEVALGPSAVARTKRYFLNSDTQLLEVVRYEIQTERGLVPVEVRVGGWQTVQGQRVPNRVTRLEGGRGVLSFSADAAELSPRGSDPANQPGREAF